MGLSIARTWLPASQRHRWPSFVALGVVAAFAVLVLGNILDQPVRTAFDDLASAAAALVAAGLALWTARAQHERRLRGSWALIGAGLLSWGLADLFWCWSELVQGVTPVTPSLADIGYLATLPLAFAGILLRPTLQPRAVARRILLIDTGLAMSALLAVAWVLVIGPILQLVTADLLVQAIALAYPIGDLCILCCLVIAVLREAEGGPATVPLLLGLAALAIGDSMYAALVVQQAYVTGHPVDVVWFGALASIGLAATRERQAIADAAAASQTTHGQTTHGQASAPRRAPAGAAIDPPWRYMTPTVLLAMATIVVWTASLQRGVAPPSPAEVFLGIAWLLLLARVYLGFQQAAEGQQRERRLRVGHATSFRREQERRRQLEAVRDVTTELTRELDLTALLTLITRRAASLVDAPIGAVFLWDEAAGRLIPRAWHGLGSWFSTHQPQRGEGAAGRALELGRGVIVNAYPTARDRFRPILEHAAIEAALAVPIVSQGKLVGVISAADEQVGRTFDEHDLNLLELFANQAAVAIEHSRLVDEAASVEALRELSRLKTELLSTVSHELRTPLTLIHGYAELLQARAATLSPADVAMMADEVLLGSRTMIRLVDDLLDFSRMDGARLRMERVRVDIADLLQRHVQAWRGQVGGERLRLDVTPPLEAYADPARLDQVIRNLISNALNHAPAGEIVLRGYSDPGWIRLEIVDRGPGIPEDELPRIWESFFRGDRARNSPNRGSGLGLAVVRQLVELHGGRAEVESQAGHGATFRIWLPSAPPNGKVDAAHDLAHSPPHELAHQPPHDLPDAPSHAPPPGPGDAKMPAWLAAPVIHSQVRSEGE